MPDNESEEKLFLSIDADDEAETGETEAEKAETVESNAESAETETPDDQPEDQADVTPSAEADDQKNDDAGGMVPSWRLREQTEALRAREAELLEIRQKAMQAEQHAMYLEQQFQARQQQQQAPDRWQDPEAYEAHRDQMQQSAFEQLQRQIAENNAYARFGYDTVQEAMSAAVEASRNDPQLDRMIATAPNPWAAAVEWHKRERVVREVGDPESYKAKVREELASDPEFRKQLLAEMRQQASGQPAAAPPNKTNGIPSMSKVTAAPEPTLKDMTEEDFFRL